jgi:hypothetical protein
MVQIKKMIFISAGFALASISLSSEANLLTNGTLQGNTTEVGAFNPTYCYEPVGVNFYAGGPGYNGTECTSAFNGWSGYFAVIGSTSSPWGTPSGISGWQSGFGSTLVGLQATHGISPTEVSSSLEQTVSVAAGESLTLSWYDAGRQYFDTTAGYEVTFNGVDIFNHVVTTGNPWSLESVTFTAPGSGVLEFQSVNVHQTESNSDATAFIADVSLTQNDVPEPASVFLVGIAFAGFAFARRAP